MRGMRRDARQDRLASLRRLSDADLVARVKRLAARERRATALLVAYLAELDTRDVHLRAGYSSLFVYCRDALALSEHEAYNRIEVARAARRFPVILEMLGAGSVNLTAVRLLAPHLTPENHRHVLESARGKRKAEVEEIVARLAPFPEVPPYIRKLPAPKPALPPPEFRGPAGQVVPFASASAAPLPPAVPPAGVSPATHPVPPLPRQGPPARSPRSRRIATSCSARSTAPRSRSCGSPRTCCGTRSPRATTRPSSTGPSRPCSRISRGRGSRPRRAPYRPARRRRDHATSRPRSSARSGCAIWALRVREHGRPPLQRARVRGVPPRAAVRSGGRDHRREHPAAVPPTQRLRGAGVFRAR